MLWCLNVYARQRALQKPVCRSTAKHLLIRKYYFSFLPPPPLFTHSPLSLPPTVVDNFTISLLQVCDYSIDVQNNERNDRKMLGNVERESLTVSDEYAQIMQSSWRFEHTERTKSVFGWQQADRHPSVSLLIMYFFVHQTRNVSVVMRVWDKKIDESGWKNDEIR